MKAYDLSHGFHVTCHLPCECLCFTSCSPGLTKLPALCLSLVCKESDAADPWPQSMRVNLNFLIWCISLQADDAPL